MIRAHISFDQQEYDLVKREALALGISVAEFIRLAVREALTRPGESPWMRYAGFVETGSPRSSRAIDEVIYGQEG